MTARLDAMAALASDPFHDAPPRVKAFLLSKVPAEVKEWVESKVGSRPRARDRDRDTKIRELEEENARLKEEAKEKAQRQAEKQAEEIRRQAEENQNLRAELEKLRQSKQKSTAGTSEQAEQRAENIERQLAEQHAKEIENLRAELAKKIEELEAEKERLKQEAEKAKRQAELELRQQNTAGTDAVSGAPASGPLSSSAASSTASSEQESSAGFTDSASTSSTSSSTPRESQSDAPLTKPAPLEVDPGSGRKILRSFLPINSPLGDAYAASSSDPEPQSSSSSAQDAADIDTPDAADAAPPGSNPGAQSPSSSSLSSPPDILSQDTADPPPNANTNSMVDPETPKPQRPRSVLKKPKFRGPHKHRLLNAVRWGKAHFQKKGVNEFEPGKFIRAGVFHEVCTMKSWPVIDRSSVHALDKMKNRCFAVILCHVEDGLQLSGGNPNHFVVAIVDWREETVENLQGKSRGGRKGKSGKKSGKFTHWGMDRNMADRLREDCEKELEFELEDSENELGDYTGNTCLLQCLTAVRSYFGETTPDGDQYFVRWFYLEMLLQHWVDCYNGEATSADTQTAIAEGPFAAGPPPGSAGQHGNKAMVESVPSDGPAPQPPQSAAHFISAQFAPPAGPSRKRLPNGRTTASGGTSTAFGCSPLPSSSPLKPPLRSMHVDDMGPNLAKNLWNKFGPSIGGMIRIEGLSPPTSAELKEKIQQPDQEWDLFGVGYSLDERGTCRVRLADPEGGFSVPDFSDAVPQKDPERFLDDICANPPKEVINYYVGPQCTNRKEQFNGLLHPGKLAKLAELRRQKGEERGDSRQDWEVAGVTTPYEHIGHRLSATCFHREDAHYWSANINLSGEKIWVVIKPESTGVFEAYVRGRYGSLDCDQWLRHHNLLIGPSTLRAAGIEFEVLSAQPGTMVVTRPGQYHMVVNRTPSFATAINFLMLGDSLMPKAATKVCEGCGLWFAKEEKLWDFEHVGKNQLSLRPKRAAALRPAVSSASSTSPSKKKRPAAEQIDTDSPSKQLQKKLRELPPPKTLAENLTNKEAMLRGVKQLLAAKEMADSPQTSTGLKVRGQWFQQAAELYRLGLKHERSSAFFALLSVVALMSAMEKMRARIPSGFKQVPPEAYNAVFQQIGGTKRAFDDKMGRSRKLARVFNHKYRGLLLFVCFDNDSPSTISAFTKMSDGDVAELHMAIDNDKRAGALARIGNEFLGCILKDTAFRNGVWADRPYQQFEEMADEGLFDLITQTGISK
ncbi:hypothetical protein RB601_003601 [Gaeumannomyces tritici]